MRRIPVLLLGLALVVAACSSGGDDDAALTSTTAAPTTGSSSTSTSTATSSTTAAPPTVTAPPPPGCVTSPPASVPDGAVSGPIPDVDGDGRGDTGFVDQTRADRRIGVVTAGGTLAAAEVGSAAPGPISLFVADADHAGGPEVLASDGRFAGLFTFVDCRIEQIVDQSGQPYRFDLGLGDEGTGVGCATIHGEPHLVGLQTDGGDEKTVRWSRTIVELDGTTATNGATDHGTFRHPDDDDGGIALLHSISCGDRTIADDGIHGEPT